MKLLQALLLILMVGSVFADCVGYNDTFYVRALDAKYRAIEGAKVWIKYDRGTSFGSQYFTTPNLTTNDTGAVRFEVANQGTLFRAIDCNIVAGAYVGTRSNQLTFTEGVHGDYIDVVLNDVYRVNFHVSNQFGTPISSATIEVDNNTITTDGNGNSHVYLQKGNYNYLASYLSSKQSGNVEIGDNDVNEAVAIKQNTVNLEVVDDQGNSLPIQLSVLNQTLTIDNGKYHNDKIFGDLIEYSVKYNGVEKNGTFKTDGTITRVVYDLNPPTFGSIQTDQFNGKNRLKIPISDNGPYASGVDTSTLKVLYRQEPSNDSSWATATTFISARNIYTSEFPGLEDNKIISFKIQVTDKDGNKATIDGRFSTYPQNTAKNDTNTQDNVPDNQGIPFLYIIIGVIIIILIAYVVIRTKNKAK